MAKQKSDRRDNTFNNRDDARHDVKAGEVDSLIEEIGFYFWVIMVGVFGGLLNLANSGASGKSKLHRALNALIGTLSSMFVCWLAYEAALYFTQAPKFSLAIGGFFAWRGAEWVTAMIDKAIDKKIDNFGDSNYDYTPRPPRDYDDIGDEK